MGIIVLTIWVMVLTVLLIISLAKTYKLKSTVTKLTMSVMRIADAVVDLQAKIFHDKRGKEND